MDQRFFGLGQVTEGLWYNSECLSLLGRRKGMLDLADTRDWNDHNTRHSSGIKRDKFCCSLHCFIQGLREPLVAVQVYTRM
jgi:hypothetical protein